MKKILFCCILCMSGILIANNSSATEKIIPNILTLLLLDSCSCDENYDYNVIYTGEDVLWQRKHCKDGYVHELGQVEWKSKSYDYWVYYKIHYGGSLMYRVGQWEQTFYFVAGFDWYRATEFYEKGTKTMECVYSYSYNGDCFPPCESEILYFRRLINGSWADEEVSSYADCIATFSSYLPTTPVAIYVPGDCHQWWDHGTETCNY